ncbi:MAG: Kae1-associated serine/threonine protein kinase [Nanoarchaeota archaeon]|nr:Kae1-associated serine/threonine protein kinase [Nanoarchaeota archaeon]MBU0977098.1 Kae1-associated serine/threonine protein kinase [Nanoarchaeota archaeon]
MKPQIIQQGAEAVLIRSGDVLLKRRVEKGYRIKELDEKIRKLRTRSEAKLLEKAGKLINVPRVLKVDEKAKEIEMEFIAGEKLSENLDRMKNWKEVCFEIGRNIALLHGAEIIHGDSTTSNMIWNSPQLRAAAEMDKARFARSNSKPVTPVRPRDASDSGSSGKLYFIDFGLGFANGRVEDKAVDLYLIKEALEAKHFLHWEELFKAVLEGYKKTSKNSAEVLKRLEKVEKRGRYKEQY